MSALIYNADKYACRVLVNLLNEIGIATVLPARSAAQFQYFLKREHSALQLIVYCSNPNDSFRFQVFPLLRENPELAATPLILISETFALRPGPVAASPHDFRRVDYVINRPFGRKQLRAAVEGANKQRARSRDILVMMSAREPVEALSAMYENSGEMHWRALERAQNLEQLKFLVEHHGYRVGSILIDDHMPSLDLVNWLTKFNKTRQGVVTPVIFLSRDPERVQPMRQQCDLFWRIKPNDAFDMVSEWAALLSTVSKRLVDRWSIREDIVSVRHMLKAGQFKSARKSLIKLTKANSETWELHELLGIANEKLSRWQEAMSSYQTAIDLNPCSPVGHLGRLNIGGLGERISMNEFQLKRFREEALKYCPRHPQILQAVNRQAVNL